MFGLLFLELPDIFHDLLYLDGLDHTEGVAEAPYEGVHGVDARPLVCLLVADYNIKPDPEPLQPVNIR